MQLTNIRLGPLSIARLDIPPGTSVCVLGGNDSGKNLLGELMAGLRAPESGAVIERPTKVGYLSFQSLQAEYEREIAEDDTDSLDRIDYGSTGREILEASGAGEEAIRTAAREYGVEALLKRGCRQFSTGETRRIYLARELLRSPEFLVLDEPYEGLDSAAREALEGTLCRFASSGKSLCLLLADQTRVPEFIDILILLERGSIAAAGSPDRLLERPEVRQLLSIRGSFAPELPAAPVAASDPAVPLAQLSNCSVRYDGVYQFRNFTWRLAPGEHTFISGPNGSGKSTLLALLTGDHPQCYVNAIEIFGYRRGSGESIWDIKRHLGIVSPALHRDYRPRCSLETVVLSGFHDSIGLYRQPSANEIRLARDWLEVFGMSAYRSMPFHSLSYGQQRLGLVARALAKQPPLLILDEPTQGLDELNRHLTLACLQRLAALERTTLLFVSHREEERLPLFRRSLQFHPSSEPGTRYWIEQRHKP